MSDQEVLRELRKISKVLTLSNSAVIEQELNKIASTNERKQVWVYMDGQRMLQDLASLVKVTPQAVGQFLNAGVAVELIEYERGKPPRRILDYVPPDWLSLVNLQQSEGTQQTIAPVPEKAV